MLPASYGIALLVLRIPVGLYEARNNAHACHVLPVCAPATVNLILKSNSILSYRSQSHFRWLSIPDYSECMTSIHIIPNFKLREAYVSFSSDMV